MWRFLYRLLFTTYSKSGPFHDLASPPINASFLNNLETYVVRVPIASQFGPYTATTSIATYNHNLKDASGANATPDIILLTVQGGASIVRTVTYDPSSVTSTQFNAIGNATFNFIGMALKF